MTASFKPPIGTLGSGRYAPYAQRPDGRFVHHVGGHKLQALVQEDRPCNPTLGVCTL